MMETPAMPVTWAHAEPLQSYSVIRLLIYLYSLDIVGVRVSLMVRCFAVGVELQKMRKTVQKNGGKTHIGEKAKYDIRLQIAMMR